MILCEYSRRIMQDLLHKFHEMIIRTAAATVMRIEISERFSWHVWFLPVGLSRVVSRFHFNTSPQTHQMNTSTFLL